MMATKFAGCLVIAVIVITGFAQNPAKPYTEWSEKEVKKALDNSPWAHSQIETDTSEMFYRPDAVTATGPNSSSDRATNGQTNQATSVNYHIRFLSALPVREAYARRIALDQKTPNPQLLSQLQGFVERDFSAYIVVTVSYDTKDPRFANAPNQAFAAAVAATLKPATYLERNDGKRLFLDDYKPPSQDGLGAKFIFSRIVDGGPFLNPTFTQVRFYSELSKKIKLDQRFKVSDMQYNGKLEY